MHPEALTKEGAAIFPFLSNFEGFYLAGGTALSLQLGHRVSADFDLFNPKDISENLLATAQKVFAGYSVNPSVNNSDELTVFINGVKVTFLKYPFPVLEKIMPCENLPLLSVSELAATKAYTIGRRGSFKDYIDLYFAIADGLVALPRIIDLAQRKYEDIFNGRLFLEQLIYLKDVAEEDISFLKELKTKEQIEEFFIEEVKKLKL